MARFTRRSLSVVGGIFLLILFFAYQPSSASAQSSAPQKVSTSSPTNVASTSAGQADLGSADPNAKPASNSTPPPAGNATNSCDSFFTLGSCLLKTVAGFILTFANLLLGVAGALLNWVVIKTVFQFGNLIGNSPGLLLAWGIMRDIGNMLLLFGFIFMGLATILDLHSFPTRKAIPQLLIFAVLMNFSLFAAEAVIDTSNALSSVFYSQANTDPCLDISGGIFSAVGISEQDAKCIVDYGIAGHIMQSTGLASLFKVNGNLGVEAVTFIGLALFSTIGAIVMFAAAIMLVIRVVVLSFLMVSAPIGFAGMAIPPLRRFANDWWSKLISQAFFAPVLFLLLFISLKITDGFITGGSGTTAVGLAGAITSPDASAMGTIMIFTIVIGFLVASLVAAKSLGAAGAAGAIGFSKKIVLGTYGAAGGFAGRSTIGKGSVYAQKKYESLVGKAPKGVRNFISNSPIDKAISGTLKAGQNARFGSGASFKEKKAEKEARDKVFGEIGRKANLRSELDSALSLPKSTSKDNRVAEILERLSTKELEELDLMKKSGKDLDALVQNLSPEKFAALVKDGGAFTVQQQGVIKEARFKDIRDQQAIITSTTTTPAEKGVAQKTIKDRIKKYSAKDLENSPSTLLTDDFITSSLTNAQRDDLLRGGKLSPGVARKVRQFDPVELTNTAFAEATSPTDVAAAVAKIAKLNPKQAARLKSEVLESEAAARVLTPKILAAIQERNEIDDSAAKRIKAQIEKYGTKTTVDYLTSPAGMAYWS